jgi:pyochelin biosynthetic protein PchG
VTRRPRVVVCGTKFGQVYLHAFTRPDPPFALAGVLARGSARSRAVAAHHGVPLFTAVAELPGDVELACVVVRGGLLGGPGVELAHTLLARGIHVLQEHPLHHDELASCLRVARQHRAVHHLTTFYHHQPPVRSFIAAARALLRRQPPVYLDAACGYQVAYSLFDILGRVLGGVRPWEFADLPPVPDRVRALLPDGAELPFRSLDGVLAGVPLTLRVQNQLDPADPDNHAHLLHRVTVGTEGGALTLVATHGPTVWNPRPDFPRAVRETDSRPHFAAARGDHLDVPSTALLGPAEAPGYRQVFDTVWPVGVMAALTELREAARGGEPPDRRAQYYLTLCRLWQDVTARLGPPELLHAGPADPIGPAELATVARAAVGEFP